MTGFVIAVVILRRMLINATSAIRKSAPIFLNKYLESMCCLLFWHFMVH